MNVATPPLAPAIGSAPAIQSVSALSARRGCVIGIFSDSGVGKTSLLRTLPAARTIIQSWDNGTVPLSAPGYPTNEAGEFRPAWDGAVTPGTPETRKQFTDWILTAQHPYTTVVIDNLTSMEKIEIFKRAQFSEVTIRDYGDASVAVRGTIMRLCELAQKGINVIFLFHCRTDVKGAEGERFPSLSDKLAREVFGWLDMVGYMFIQPDGKTRALQFAPTNLIHAKTRFPEVRDFEVLDLSDIIGRVLGARRAKPVAAPAPVAVVTPPATVTPKPEAKKEK